MKTQDLIYLDTSILSPDGTSVHFRKSSHFHAGAAHSRTRIFTGGTLEQVLDASRPARQSRVCGLCGHPVLRAGSLKSVGGGANIRMVLRGRRTSKSATHSTTC